MSRPDGFLATGSVLQMAVAMLRGYSDSPALPWRPPETGADEAALRHEVLVLTTLAFAAVASDIDVRLVESGLAAVHVVDYRNFAHGRHTGFARPLEDVTVTALSDGASESLARGQPPRCPQEPTSVAGMPCTVAWSAGEPAGRGQCDWPGSEGGRAGIDVSP
jgi:hypothetical protein